MIYIHPRLSLLLKLGIFFLKFFSFKDPDIYNKIYIFCELFENINIYKKYDNKEMTKKCKNLSEVINNLKMKLHQTEVVKTKLIIIILIILFIYIILQTINLN